MVPLIDPLIELFFTPGSQLSLWAQSVLPISRGTVKINSTDPSDMPVINPEYLSNEVDVDIMIRASRRLGEAASTPPFSDFLTPTALAQSGLPALNATDEEWRVWMLETSVNLIVMEYCFDVIDDITHTCRYLPGVHFIGSNSMMPQELGGVVSPELLIFGGSHSYSCRLRSEADNPSCYSRIGTTNIRVADASIMPLGVFPHCTLGLYGVGEKAAEMILQAASTD